MKAIATLSTLLFISTASIVSVQAAPTFGGSTIENHVNTLVTSIAATDKQKAGKQKAGKDKMAKKADGKKAGKKGKKSNHPQLVALRDKYKALRQEAGKDKALQGKLKEAFKTEAMALRKELGLGGKGKGQKPPKGDKAGKGGMKKKKQTDA